MAKRESPTNYIKVQAAIGTLGGTINSQEIRAMVDVLPVDVNKYAAEMNCVDHKGVVNTPTRGEKPVIYERTSLAGEICNDCTAVPHCILKLISDNPVNLSHLPREIALRQEF